MLITFEGGEGAGKTTLIRRVAEHLQKNGVDVFETREPGGTMLGAEIRNLVLKAVPGLKICPKAELMLYLTSRAETVEELIEPALAAGKTVLCDRFNDSTIVYQGGARGLGVNEVKQMCDFICGPIKPDVTFYLDVDPEVGLQRTKGVAKEESGSGEMDRIESETIAFHQKVRAHYLRLAEQEPDRIVVLDANKTIDRVWEQALRVLEQCLNT